MQLMQKRWLISHRSSNNGIKNKRTIIMVTHDLDYVRQHCPQTMLLARECIGHGPSENVLTQENLERAKQLSEAFDDHAPWCQRGAA